MHTAGRPPLTDARSLVSSCPEIGEAPAATGAKPCQLHWAILGSRLCPARRIAMAADAAWCLLLWQAPLETHLPGFWQLLHTGILQSNCNCWTVKPASAWFHEPLAPGMAQVDAVVLLGHHPSAQQRH